MALGQLKADAGLERADRAKQPVAKTAITPIPRIMDFKPSAGLASGLKRISGRGGISRLGKTTRKALSAGKHGKPIVTHRF